MQLACRVPRPHALSFSGLLSCEGPVVMTIAPLEMQNIVPGYFREWYSVLEMRFPHYLALLSPTFSPAPGPPYRRAS